MHLPNPIYEWWPSILMISGLGVAAWLDHGFAYFGGAILIAAGFLIYKMRRETAR